MVRKRTRQDLNPSSPPTAVYASMAASSSPYLTRRGSETDTPYKQDGFLSSPPTVYSSPMGRSTSAQSTFGSFTQSLGSSAQKKALATPQERPGMKRRKTVQDVNSSPASPIKQEYPSTPADADDFAQKGNGKDGEDVWPRELEEAFHTALRLLPRLGRKKILVNNKPCGRNELIGGYIERKTGKARSRKQVSSHIQVLKNMRKDDAEFMALVSEPAEGDDRFAPGNALLFFGDDVSVAPYHATFLEHSLSSHGDNAYPPPIDLSAVQRLPPIPVKGGLSSSNGGTALGLNSPFVFNSSHQATTPTTTITNALREMTVVPQGPSPPLPSTLSFAPVELSMHVLPAKRGRRQPHVYAQLDGHAGPTQRVFLEDLPEGFKRYPGLVDMVNHLPCQFLHVKLNLDIPTLSNAGGLSSSLDAYVRLHTFQNLALTAVTTIFCHGDEIIHFVDELGESTPLTASGSGSTGLASPTSPGQPVQHKYAYDVPFSPEYWTFLLRAGPASSPELGDFGRGGKDRVDLAHTLGMFSVVQEFVVRDEQPRPYVGSRPLSRGSMMGDVVLVVAYDLAVVDGVKKGTAELSMLSVRNGPSPRQPPKPHTPFYVPVHSPTMGNMAAPPMLRSQTSPAAFSKSSPPSIAVAPPPPTSKPSMPPPPLPASAQSSMSPVKPNLSLHIPPAAQFVRPSLTSAAQHLGPAPSPRLHASVPASSPRPPPTPYTPWSQVVHTPSAPPPVHATAASPADRERERLEQLWRQSASQNEWDLHSPALMGVSAPPSETSVYPTMAPLSASLPASTTAVHGRPVIPLKASPTLVPVTAPSPRPLSPPAAADSALFPPARTASPMATFDLGSAFEEAAAYSPLLGGTTALPPTAAPSFSAFAPAAQDPFLAMKTHDSSPLPSYLMHEYLAPELAPTPPPTMPVATPELVPMSASSSSTGSTASSASVKTVESVPRSATTTPVKPPSEKQRREQDFFSSLLGSSTKYTGVY
ncbi:hypothetical protein JCM8097_005980 [Rhodosporidiobolus ruineniae]